MVTVERVLRYLDSLAPCGIKEEWDNVGLLVGYADREIGAVLVALDITGRTIEEAKRVGAELIVSHHPLFFSLDSVTDGSTAGSRVLALAKNDISAICMHTNLDAAPEGVNAVLAERLGIVAPRLLHTAGQLEDGRPYCIGRGGEIAQKRPLRQYLAHVKAGLSANGIRYVGNRDVFRVACIGGSGGEFLREAYDLGCDTFVTADVKHHVFIEAQELGINLIDAGHFSTENVVVPVVASKLRAEFPTLRVMISETSEQPERFFLD